jgi:hypothetical protein
MKHLLLAALLALAALAWWQAGVDEAAVAARVPRMARTDAWPPPLPARLPDAAEPAPVRTAAAAVHQAAAPAVFDICGLGRLSAPAGSEADAAGGVDALPAPVGREPLTQARERMLVALRAGPPRARIAALLMAQPGPDDEAGRAAWAQALVQQAMDSRDAVALAWAEEACGHLSDGPSCRLQLIRARLQLEPDNGHHWAALADEDPGAADEAWRGLQQARRWHEAPQALLLATQAALPPDVPGYLRLALGAEITTRAAALPSPGEGFLLERCRGADAARRSECGALAQLLVERSDAPQTLAQGHRIAQAAGWPAQRLEELQREIQALGRSGWAADAQQPLSCTSVETWQRHVAEVATVGELAALRTRRAEVDQPAARR